MKNINDLRDNLFDTIELLKSGKIDTSQAKAITGIAGAIIESAKLEVDLIKSVGRSGDSVKFISEVKLLDNGSDDATKK